MSQSQGSEVRRPSRRTVASGAAWAVPVIAVGAAAPLASASGNECVPTFTIQPGSFKCCNGGADNNNARIELLITDVGNCVGAPGSAGVVCIWSVVPDTGSGNATMFPAAPFCRVEGETFTIFMLGASNCSQNLRLEYSVGVEGPRQIAFLDSDNIPNGNTDGQCVPPPTTP